MPLFAIYAIDAPTALPLRMEHYAAHRAFVEDQEGRGVILMLSGPLQSDDGSTMTGSLFILEAPDRAAADYFAAHDPFTLHRVWAKTHISRFHARANRLRDLA